MPENFKLHFENMHAAVDDAKRRLSDSSPLEDNREALKTLMWVLLNNFSGLVDAGGGETIYIPSPDYLSDDVERAFLDPIEAYDANEGRGMPARAYGTLDARTQGLASGARA